MYLFLICGLLLYGSIGILTEFKIGHCNYVRLKSRFYLESNQGDTGGFSTWEPLGYVKVIWCWSG